MKETKEAITSALIYATFYRLNPNSDARTNGLWKDVRNAKNEDDLNVILNDVENEVYD